MRRPGRSGCRVGRLAGLHRNAVRKLPSYTHLMVISVGHPIAAWVTAQHSIRVAPDLDIVARVHWRDEGERYQRFGVREVVRPQMEAGLEMLRHSLNRYHADPSEVEPLVADLRNHLSFGESDGVAAMLERGRSHG